jgi:hypothetical protein
MPGCADGFTTTPEMGKDDVELAKRRGRLDPGEERYPSIAQLGAQGERRMRSKPRMGYRLKRSSPSSKPCCLM